MKPSLLFAGAFALVLALSGCVSNPQGALKHIPPGTYAHAAANITGKFSSTQIDAQNVIIGPAGTFDSGHIHLRHSNVYIPLIELELDKAPAAPSPNP